MNLTLKAPKPWEDTNLNITAKITCEDVRNEKYEDIGFKVIKIEKNGALLFQSLLQEIITWESLSMSRSMSGTQGSAT